MKNETTSDKRRREALERAKTRGRPLSRKEIDSLYAQDAKPKPRDGVTPAERRIVRRTVEPGSRRQ